MSRTKSLATLMQHYGNERIFKPRANKIPTVYKILNREVFKKIILNFSSILTGKIKNVMQYEKYRQYLQHPPYLQYLQYLQ